MTAPSDLSALRLFLAEGDAEIRKDLKTVLTYLRYRVIGETDDACETLEAVQALRPDLVVLDPHLSEEKGLAIAAQLYRERLAPVVLFASEFDLSLVHRAASLGVYSFLVKPIREASLAPILEVAYSRWKAEQEAEDRLQQLRHRDGVQDVVERAKSQLMRAGALSEPEAHRLLQKRSMDSRRSLKQVALEITDAYEALNLRFTETATPGRNHPETRSHNFGRQRVNP